MGKGSKPTIGYWYHVAFHAGLGAGPIDAFLEFRGGDQVAWTGELTASGTISINQPNLWGGEKDQGGIVGDVDVMFGEAAQEPNTYLLSVLGNQVPAWRGLSTLVFKGGKYGAMNPYPQKPSFKFRKIKNGWEGDTCWYPEKAEISLANTTTLPANATGWEYQTLAQESNPGYENLAVPSTGWLAGVQGPFAGGDLVSDGNTEWPIKTVLWVRRTITVAAGGGQKLVVVAENGCVVFINGAIAGAVNRTNDQIVSNQDNTFEFPVIAGQTYDIVIKAFDEATPAGGGTFLSMEVKAPGLVAMNPAHILYYARTHSEMGREPIASINDASLRAAADWFHAQSFGLCTAYDPGSETVAQFTQRIEKVAGCSMNRSPVDGLWYLDIANGEYDLDALPILTDDDILEFSESPTTLDDVINSVSIQYFDPAMKQTVLTPPLQALALVNAYGPNPVVTTYSEIPTSDIATRVAQRDLLATITPSRAFELTTTRKPYAWRRNTYFRLQAPKRGIADMVCILAGAQSGTLKSGAMRITAAQDIYSLPSASFVAVEPGVDTRPSPIPLGIVNQVAFEAPYLEVVQRLTRADLTALPDDVGYALAAATDPSIDGGSRDFTLTVSSDGGTTYLTTANGDFCPSALIVEGDALSGDAQTNFTLAGGSQLGSVAVGQAALWDSEICRVDAIDVDVNTITLGRGCADTTPQAHDPNSRIWFYDVATAADRTEYTAGETVDVRLLTNTGTQQLDADLATPMALTFDQRQVRPYPPGNFKLNDQAYPTALSGEITATWAHRDRLLQADQLVDTTQADVGPEAGTTYHLRYYLDDVLVNEESGITGTIGTPYTYSAGGAARIELQSERDTLTSWQSHIAEFTYEGAVVTNFIALPLTYDEQDYAGTMTWVRQGNGPHVTPQGFEGDGYEARLKSTTIPTWMQSASAALTMHASISFYPQKLGSTSAQAIYAGEDDGQPIAKIGYAILPDVSNSGITQIAMLAGTGGTGFVQKNMGRSSWKYQFRIPDVTSGGHVASPQAIVFLDADTVLVSCHFEETFSRVYKVRLSDAAVLGQFDATGDFVHIACFAFRSNGDLWALASSGKACRIDLATSLSAGTLSVLDTLSFSGITVGALAFVTVASTEYAIIPEYLTTGAPYVYAVPASLFGTATIAAADRYKRFTGCPIEVQGCVMRSSMLYTSSLAKPGAGTGSRFGYIGRFDIVAAITSTADGGAITADTTWDAASKYTEDCAVHPTTNELWTAIEGISAVGSDNGGLSFWSSPLDGSLAENHYTTEYDGAGTITIRINNRAYDSISATLGIAVATVCVGGLSQTVPGFSNKFFAGYIRNIVLQDQPMTAEQYDTAIAGTTYEPNTLTAYTFTMTNPGAESGTTATGWTNEAGGLGVLTYPASTVPPHSGSRNFSGGTSASTIARQRLDILAQTGLTGTQVDAGGIWAKVRWWQSSFDSVTDPAGMGLRTLDGSAVSQGESYSGIASTPNANGSSSYPWYPRCFAKNLPSGARSLDALIKVTRTGGTNNDGWLDDIAVTVYRQ